MVSIKPDHVQGVLHAINLGPCFKHMSMPVKEMGVGYAVVELRVGREHLNPFGGIHGGAYASIIDTDAYCELEEGGA